MAVDTPETAPASTDLEPHEAASLFEKFIDPADDPNDDPPKVEETEPVEAEPDDAPEIEAADDAPEVETVTVKIDGKEVEVPLDELKKGYQRQADYTRKTMEVAESRKAADAEAQKAQAERAEYAQNLQRMQARLEGALQEQQNTDWDALIQSDPVEYLRQKHLAETRQAALHENLAEQQRLATQFEADRQRQQTEHLAQQQEALLAKLPEWKDEAKAKAEQSAIREYLLDQGYGAQEVASVGDARAVVMARKAMLYDRMLAKAQAAAKKVSTMPAKVERPGAGEPQHLDKRSAAYQRLGKSGSVDDAAAVFAGLIN